MFEIEKIADDNGLAVVEDCAQSIGTEYKNKKVGSFGNFGCFSFFPTKNLGAAGEGGLITTNDEDTFNKLKALRVHGSIERYQHEMIGYNARLNEIQCAVLRIKLRRLQEWTKKRQAHANLYNKLFSDLPVGLPIVGDDSNHVYHQYAIKIKNNREKVMNYLQENGVSSAVHYPKPIHLQDAYAFLGYKKGDLPISEQLSQEILSLPVYPELTEAQITMIATLVKKAINS